MLNADMLFDDQESDGSKDESAPAEVVADEGIERTVEWFRSQLDLENRFSAALRQSIDEVLDGQRTGRYDIGDMEKTEKTYLGTKVEIVCRAEFKLPRGHKMDYRVAGVDIDAKFSLTGEWMIPSEAMGHLCLLMSVNDASSTFKVGIVRISEDILRGRGNKDKKRQISSHGRSAIRWIFDKGHLRENLLLRLDSSQREIIFAVPAGQRRVNELFRRVQGRIVDRNAVLTVAKQLDAPKRVRDARQKLGPEGVIILGHQKESPRIASALNLPTPEKGTWVSVRLVPAELGTNRRRVDIDGSGYVVAEPGEAISPAPRINY